MELMLSISRYLLISVALFTTSNAKELSTCQDPGWYDSCGLLYKDSGGKYFDINGNRRKVSDGATSQNHGVIEYVIKRLIMNDCSKELDLKISIIIERDGCLSNFRVISGISNCHTDLIRVRPLVDCAYAWPKPEIRSNEDGVELVFDVHLASY